MSVHTVNVFLLLLFGEINNLMAVSNDSTTQMPPPLQQPSACTSIIKHHLNLLNEDSLLADKCLYEWIHKNWVNAEINKVLGQSGEMSPQSPIFHQFSQLLTKEPPNKGNVIIKIDQIDLHMVFTHEMFQNIRIYGFLHSKWTDLRLSWNGKTFEKIRKNSVDLFSLTSQPGPPVHGGFGFGFGPDLPSSGIKIWLPGFAHKQLTSTASNEEGTTARLHRNGTVEMSLGFQGSSTCTMDFENFPHDQHKCCVSLKSERKYQEHMKVIIDESKVTVVENAYMFKEWKLIKQNATWIDAVSGEDSRLDICVFMERAGYVHKYRIVHPLAVCALLAAVLPVFSPWKLQILAKVLTIIFLMLFVFFIQPYRGVFGSSVPKYLKIVDLLLWVTVFSMMITVILWGLSSRSRSTPPPYNILTFSRKINSIFYFTGSGRSNNYQYSTVMSTLDSGAEIEPDSPSSVVSRNAMTLPLPPRSDSNEWSQVFLAINNVFLIIASFVYIAGLIIIL